MRAERPDPAAVLSGPSLLKAQVEKQLEELEKKNHPEIPHSTSVELSMAMGSAHGGEGEKLKKLFGSIKTRSHAFKIVSYLGDPRFGVFHQMCFTFYSDLLIRPEEVLTELSKRGDMLSTYSNLVESIPDAFKYFTKKEQSLILKGATNILPRLAPGAQLPIEQLNGNTFPVFKSVSQMCAQLLDLMIAEGYEVKKLNNFFTRFISSLISIAVSIAENARVTQMKLTSMAGFIGELLPFIAKGGPIVSGEDAEIHNQMQEVWIILVLFSSANIDVFFAQWNDHVDSIVRFMPSLMDQKPRVDLVPTKFRVENMLKVIAPASFQRVEQIYPIFTQMLCADCLKSLQQLSREELVYALSIYALEFSRADRCIFGPIFDYYEVEYNGAFSAVLAWMINPIFQRYSTSLEQSTDVELRSQSIENTIKVCIEKYGSESVRVQGYVDEIFGEFGSSHPTGVISEKVISALSKSMESMRNVGSVRRQAFNNTMQKMVSKALEIAEYPMMASMEEYIVDTTRKKYEKGKSSKVTELMQFLPAEYRERFLTELHMKLEAKGGSRYAKKEDIKEIEEETERILMIGGYLREHPEEKEMVGWMGIEKDSMDKKVLKLGWTEVAMYSNGRSKEVERMLVDKFVEMMRGKEGIFGDKVEEKKIEYQKVILQFLVEQGQLKKHEEEGIEEIIEGVKEEEIMRDASVIPVLIPLAQLGCMAISKESQEWKYGSVMNEKPRRFINETRHMIIRVILKCFSFMNEERIFRYIGKEELRGLEQLVEEVPRMLSDELLENDKGSTRGSTIGNEASASANGQGRQRSGTMNSSNRGTQSLLSSMSKYSKGKISTMVSLSMSKSQMNYAGGERAKEMSMMGVMGEIMANIICEMLQLFSCFLSGGLSPQVSRSCTLHQLKQREFHLTETVPLMWDIDASSLYTLITVKDEKMSRSIKNLIVQIGSQDFARAASVDRLALILARTERFNKTALKFWKAVKPTEALSLVTPEGMRDEEVSEYVGRCFMGFKRDEALMFIPQLVQALRIDACGRLREFFKNYSRKSEVFRHYLLWNIQSEKAQTVSKGDNLPEKLTSLERELIEEMNEEEKKNCDNEFALIDKLAEVSESLMKLKIDERPPALIDYLNNLELGPNLYVPSNPNYRIQSIDAIHSVPLKSHAKVPILVHFNVTDDNDPSRGLINFSCIFKVHDDVRQDALMIQFIDVFKGIFEEAGIDSYLLPYRVFATGKDRGVIECIEHAKSRHDIGRAANEDLLSYYIHHYGPVESKPFKKAQDNFVKSMAPYSLLCYLFQVKDRHNANIMIDEEGHVIHIDFGFIFEISPGGNLKFERAPFKLTKEMIGLMGGDRNAEPFKKFEQLLVKCFLAVRSRHEEIEAMAELMRNAGFPCFRADSIQKLQERLCLTTNPKGVVAKVNELISQAYMSQTTVAYDIFQAAQNEIFFVPSNE